MPSYIWLLVVRDKCLKASTWLHIHTDHVSRCFPCWNSEQHSAGVMKCCYVCALSCYKHKFNSQLPDYCGACSIGELKQFCRHLLFHCCLKTLKANANFLPKHVTCSMPSNDFLKQFENTFKLSFAFSLIFFYFD